MTKVETSILEKELEKAINYTKEARKHADEINGKDRPMTLLEKFALVYYNVGKAFAIKETLEALKFEHQNMIKLNEDISELHKYLKEIE